MLAAASDPGLADAAAVSVEVTWWEEHKLYNDGHV